MAVKLGRQEKKNHKKKRIQQRILGKWRRIDGILIRLRLLLRGTCSRLPLQNPVGNQSSRNTRYKLGNRRSSNQRRRKRRRRRRRRRRKRRHRRRFSPPPPFSSSPLPWFLLRSRWKKKVVVLLFYFILFLIGWPTEFYRVWRRVIDRNSTADVTRPLMDRLGCSETANRNEQVRRAAASEQL